MNRSSLPFLADLRTGRRLAHLACLSLVALLTACAHAPAPKLEGQAAWAQLAPGEAAWTHQAFPGKVPTSFGYTRHDGRDAMAAVSVSSASMLRRRVHIEPDKLPRIGFSWQVPELIEGADMALRDKDDCPVRIVLAFDGDRSKLSAKDAMLSELARALTGEEMPYATLMYVWSSTREVGAVIHNPRTDRIRKIVVEHGPEHLRQWLDYERDIRADYEKAFGEPPGALIGIGLMTDSDNTQSQTRAWYGPVKLLATGAAKP